MGIEIAFRGTKDGYKVLYPAGVLTTSIWGLSDIRNDSPNGAAIGEECYGFSFFKSEVVYTIYKSMFDGIRPGMAVGFIGISFKLPLGYKMEGSKIKELLDELMKEYGLFAPENILKEKEDWNFIPKLVEKFEPNIKKKSITRNTRISGNEAAAYIYCNENEIPKYLEKVNHSEYNSFREILFIERKKEKGNNILLAIKSSKDLTDKIDLDNPEYSVEDLTDSETEVFINGGPFYDGLKIKKSDSISIEFKKLNFISKTIKGTCLEFENLFSNYISINNEDYFLEIRRAPHMDAKITINQKHRNSNYIESDENRSDNTRGIRTWIKQNESKLLSGGLILIVLLILFLIIRIADSLFDKNNTNVTDANTSVEKGSGNSENQSPNFDNQRTAVPYEKPRDSLKDSMKQGTKEEVRDSSIDSKKSDNHAGSSSSQTEKKVVVEKKRSENNKYSNEDFKNLFLGIDKKGGLDNLDTNKMTDLQKELLKKIKNNFSGFKEISSLGKLSFKEFKSKINNL